MIAVIVVVIVGSGRDSRGQSGSRSDNARCHKSEDGQLKHLKSKRVHYWEAMALPTIAYPSLRVRACLSHVCQRLLTAICRVVQRASRKRKWFLKGRAGSRRRQLLHIGLGSPSVQPLEENEGRAHPGAEGGIMQMPSSQLLQSSGQLSKMVSVVQDSGFWRANWKDEARCQR